MYVRYWYVNVSMYLSLSLSLVICIDIEGMRATLSVTITVSKRCSLSDSIVLYFGGTIRSHCSNRGSCNGMSGMSLWW